MPRINKPHVIRDPIAAQDVDDNFDAIFAQLRAFSSEGVLPVQGGGTGLGSFHTGDILVATSPTTIGGLSDVAVGNVLLSGGVNALPAYGKVALSGSPTHITGTLPPGNGGTGLATYVAGDLIVATGATTLARVAIGAADTVLRSNGSAPIWGKVVLTSDVTGDLPYANLQPASAASRLLGRGSAAGAGDWQEITLGTGVALTGTVLSSTAVMGPGSATDNAIARFDGTTGSLIQSSLATITDTGLIRTAGVNAAPSFSFTTATTTGIGIDSGSPGSLIVYANGTATLDIGSSLVLVAASIIPSVHNTFNLGITGTRWGQLFLGTPLAVDSGGTGLATFGGTNRLLYTTATNTLSSIATANSSLLVTNGSGVPSWATTVPSHTVTGPLIITATGASPTLQATADSNSVAADFRGRASDNIATFRFFNNAGTVQTGFFQAFATPEFRIGTGATYDIICTAGSVNPGVTDTTTLGTSSAQWGKTFGGSYVGRTVSPPLIVGNTNNWTFTGLSTVFIIAATAGVLSNVTGLDATGMEPGRVIIFMNNGSSTINLVHESGSSTDSNRFFFSNLSNRTLAAGGWVMLIRGPLNNRWLGPIQ